jgi:uncharacterized protein
VKVAGAHAIAAPPERVFEMLEDPAILTKCIPGCEGLDRIANGEYAMRMKMGIGPVSGRFDGKVQIADRKPPESYRMTVEGQGKVGFMKGVGVISLAPGDSGSNVSFTGDVQVGGTIANVGQRLIETTAKMIIKRFFDKLQELVVT